MPRKRRKPLQETRREFCVPGSHHGRIKERAEKSASTARPERLQDSGFQSRDMVNSIEGMEPNGSGASAGMRPRSLSKAANSGKEVPMASAGRDHDINELAAALGLGLSEGTLACVRMNIDSWLTHLEDAPLSDEQKVNLTLEVVRLAIAFLDDGFAVEMDDAPCGKLSGTEDDGGFSRDAVVGSEHPKLTDTFNKVARPENLRRAGTKETPWIH